MANKIEGNQEGKPKESHVNAPGNLPEISVEHTPCAGHPNRANPKGWPAKYKENWGQIQENPRGWPAEIAENRRGHPGKS